MPGQPQCGLRLLEPVKSSVYPSPPSPRETHPRRDPNEESPESRRLFGAGLGARSPQRTPRGKHGKANTITQKRTYAPPPTPFPPFSAFPRPFVLRRDRHKETRKPEVNQQRPITARDPRTHYRRSRPTAEQERNIPQAVLFGAMRQTAGVIEHRTFRPERMTGVNRAQPLESPTKDYIYISN